MDETDAQSSERSAEGVEAREWSDAHRAEHLALSEVARDPEAKMDSGQHCMGRGHRDDCGSKVGALVIRREVSQAPPRDRPARRGHRP
jgi:hypothetical protein